MNESICKHEINENILRVQSGQKLTKPLATLNRNCEFRKKYEEFIGVKIGVRKNPIPRHNKKSYEEIKAYQKAHQKAYNQRPEIKAYKKAYNQRPEIKAYKKAYYQRPEIKAHRKAYQKAYNQRPEIKAHQKAYNQRPEIKAYKKAYYQRQKSLNKEEKA